MASKIVINLDTSKENYILAKCKQNDDLTLEASIFENGLEKDLTNCEIIIQALKADKTYIIQNTDITKLNNKITANLIRDFSRVPGTTKIEIVLVESGKQNTTFNFYLDVVGSVIRGAVESSNTVTILEELGNKIVEAGQVKEETEQLIQSGGAATTGDIQEINSQLDFISSNASKSIYQDYRFISTSFNQEQMKLVVMLSMDGINWDVIKKEGSYTPNTGNKTLRDPSLVKVSEWWYITYTKIDWGTGNNIGFCRTKDFIDFEELNDLSFEGFTKVWAPEFFRDYKTNNTYVIFNASVDGITFHSYIQQVWFSDNIVEKEGSHIQLQGNELSSMNTIDASLFQDNDRYYLTVKDETNKVNAIFESFNLTSDYKLIKTNLFPNHEGVQIIKLDNGGFRIYMDNYENREIGLGFVDTYDCFNSFTPFKKIITEDFSGAHNFVVDMKQVAKTEQFDKSFIIANRTTDFVVPSNTDITLPFNNILNKGDFALSSDGNRALVSSNGVFLISANVRWDIKDDTNERVVELRKYDINSDAIIILGKYHNNNLPNLYYLQTYTTLVYCNRGDQIFVNVYQASGSECKIKALDYAPSLKIVKII